MFIFMYLKSVADWPSIVGSQSRVLSERFRWKNRRSIFQVHGWHCSPIRSWKRTCDERTQRFAWFWNVFSKRMGSILYALLWVIRFVILHTHTYVLNDDWWKRCFTDILTSRRTQKCYKIIQPNDDYGNSAEISQYTMAGIY